MNSLIDQQLQAAEQDVASIERQAIQEAAMRDVLPIRFAENLAAFSKYMPAVAAQFCNYQPQRSFELFCTENGIPNLRWQDDGSAFYGVDPYQYCADQIDCVLNGSAFDAQVKTPEPNHFNTLHVAKLNQMAVLDSNLKDRLDGHNQSLTSLPLALCFGVGLGYQLGYLFERCEVANLFILEPNLDLFYASLYCFEWAPLLAYLTENNKGLHLFLGQNEAVIIQDIRSVIDRYGAYLILNMVAFWHYRSAAIDSLIEALDKEFYLLTNGWGFFDDNLFALSHSAHNIAKNVPFLQHSSKLPADYRQLPVLVIGNGPSLDAALPYIRKHQQHTLVIACGSSISALHRAGIKPDIYVAVERMRMMSNFLTVLNDPAYLKDILFLSVDVIHPQHQQIFDRIGLCLKGDEPLTALFETKHPTLLQQFAAVQGVNPMVGNIGLVMPLALGFRNVYLLGIDNGYRDTSHHHSKQSAYYDDEGKAIPALSWSASGTHRLPANFGGEVLSNYFFAVSAHVMGTVLTAVPDARCYNCGDGAAIKGASPLLVSDMVIPSCELDKKALLDDIYHMFKAMPLDETQLQQALECERYSQFIDKLLEQWHPLPLGKAGWMSRVQSQYDELCALTYQHPLHYRVLFGSMNHFFLMLTRMVHRYPNDADDMPELVEALTVFKEFLLETKVRYAKAFDWLDQSENLGTYHYRKSDKPWEPVS